MELKGKEYNAPWEKAFDQILTPLEEFIHRQTTSGILLMICAVIALFIANSHWGEGYHHYYYRVHYQINKVQTYRYLLDTYSLNYAL